MKSVDFLCLTGAPNDPREEAMIFDVSLGAPNWAQWLKSVTCPRQGPKLRKWKFFVWNTLFRYWRGSQLTFLRFRFFFSCSKIILWSTINGDYVCHIETTAVMKNNQRDLWLKVAKRNPVSSLCMEHTILKMFFVCLIISTLTTILIICVSRNTNAVKRNCFRKNPIFVER